ncbi:MAG TPA: hypothetical protein VHN78_00940 [Chloroflexota bacterium]|nr:hypothetical protein [Chloroflexota bacterium]
MTTPEIVMATMSWARTAQEAQLLRAALGGLARANLPVVVTDGGSGRPLVEYLRGFRHFTVLEADHPGVLAQTRRSLRGALRLGSRYILYAESDKQLFFAHGLGAFLAHARRQRQIGVMVVARSPASFATYPASQRYTETVINQLCGQVLGQHGDFSYGPLLIHRALIPFLEGLEEDIGWGWRHYLLGLAHRMGYRIAQWASDLPCPAEQRADSQAELVHRVRQLSQNLQGLVRALTISDAQLSPREEPEAKGSQEALGRRQERRP